MKYLAISVVVLVALTLGCAEMVVQGKAIDRAKMNQLVLGQTETGKVVEIFGKPDSVEKMAGGGEKYVYKYYQMKPHIFRLDEVVKQRLDITIQDNRVQRYDLTAEGVKDLPPESTQTSK
jgi:outer membrane protein assembly factor BamE (lipoprotein component of BamABCDE complex)